MPSATEETPLVGGRHRHISEDAPKTFGEKVKAHFTGKVGPIPVWVIYLVVFLIAAGLSVGLTLWRRHHHWHHKKHKRNVRQQHRKGQDTLVDDLDQSVIADVVDELMGADDWDP
eukprot:CAMPEP_0170134444 /NCGR_PEP_ID=MMETSP0033_2-20121228/1904_1 /TAXON_ID=195969 /ORGANISM="Dolichomastix tenuilepis, Strain CCMP3274" /LENGTH=114 /DNA_ID=CAMNT_0010369997 /DNA_START=62 /DNA_END=406 /DNA_ORIENTATION=+